MSRTHDDAWFLRAAFVLELLVGFVAGAVAVIVATSGAA